MLYPSIYLVKLFNLIGQMKIEKSQLNILSNEAFESTNLVRI